jgi:nucleotide-binding universal stress UspA family protein
VIKTILVPTSGSGTDQTVFATALALARMFDSHLHFLHVHLLPGSAALQVPHMEFCQGAAIAHTLQSLRQQGEHLSASARKHFEEFCRVSEVAIRDTPGAVSGVTASLSEESDDPARCLLLHARHSDLTVLGRRHNRDHLPASLVETLLMESGRPIVIAPDAVPRDPTGTIVVGWKETREAAHALAAALPLLKKARRVVLLEIAEEHVALREASDDLACQLAWHGIDAEVEIVADESHSAMVQLPQAAVQLRADLLVVGGFGRSPLRECVLGGLTRSLLEHAEFPVFMLH